MTRRADPGGQFDHQRRLAADGPAPGRSGEPKTPGAVARNAASLIGNEAVARAMEAGGPIGLVRRELGRSGEELPADARAAFEAKMGRELPDVRIHRGPSADQAAEAVNARAFTHGQDVVLGADVGPHDEADGRQVLTHELVHVLQSTAPQSFGVMPPGTTAEGEAAAGSQPTASATGIARVVEKDLTKMSDSELMNEYDLVVRYVRDQPPGADRKAGIEYVREIESMVRSRGSAPAAAAAPASATPGAPEESFADVKPDTSVPEGPPLQSGKTPLRAGDIDKYSAFNTRARTGDPYEGHEILQNAFLKAIGKIVRRGKGRVSRGNPSLAVDEALHDRISAAQARLGLHDPDQVAKMPPEEVVAKNIQALEEAGVEQSQIRMVEREATAHGVREGVIKPAAAAQPSAPAASQPPPAASPAEPNASEAPPSVSQPEPSASQAEPLMSQEPATPAAADAPMSSAEPAAPAAAASSAAEPGAALATPPTSPAAEAAAPAAAETAKPGVAPSKAPAVAETAGEPSAAPAPEGIAGPMVMNVAAPLILGAVHDKAVEAIRDRRGYAPVGAFAYAHENIISRIGRIFTGAAVEEQLAELPGRFNVTAFRANARAQAAAVKPGDTLKLVCQVPVQVSEFTRDVQNYVFQYRRNTDGKWSLVEHPADAGAIDTENVLVAPLLPVQVSRTQARVEPPDMNVIVGDAPDTDVAEMFNVHRHYVRERSPYDDQMT
jgi:hypothetical protein